MTQDESSKRFQATGKTLAWQPVMRNAVLLEPVVDDVRPEMQQVAHFAMLCVAMHARMDETDDIIQALQYCERTHGYGRIAGVLPSIVASVENAVELIPATIAQLGMQRQLANPGLFVGALVEELARIPGNTRKFPLSQYRERLSSPRVEFEDCLLGAGVAKKLGLLDELQPHLTRPYSRLMTEFRRKLGKEGVLIVDETARNVQSRERAKLGSGWAPVAATRRVWDRDSGEWASVLADPDTGEVLLDDEDLPLPDAAAGWAWLAQGQRFSRTAPVKGWALVEGETGTLRRSGRWGKHTVRTPLFTEGQGTGCLQNADGASEGTLVSAPEQHVGLRRYPVATFINRKLKGFFKLFIGDELHQFAAARSDQAIAFHQISRASKWMLGLTATVFGGRSTSLFHVLHRTSREMRAGYGPRDEHRWSEHLGVLEVTRWGAKTGVTRGEVGAFSGYARDRVVVRELPGINPTVIRYLLPHTLFARIADLGYALPSYAERVVRLDMDAAQGEQCWHEVYDPRSDGGRLFTLMKDALQDGDTSLLSVWLQTALARPNACFRDEDVLRRRAALGLMQKHETNAEPIDTRIVGQRRRLLQKPAVRECIMALPAITPEDTWLPKERWLSDYCIDQARQGRKVLVYVRQTGSRDIQGRIADALSSAGVRARVLPASLKPEHREAWVQAHTDALNALIVNPQKVDTGLDLVMFGSIVWYEVSYSLYVMWQAMRRVWRLGRPSRSKSCFLPTATRSKTWRCG